MSPNSSTGITVITSEVKEGQRSTLFVHTLHRRPAPPPRDLERAAARSLRLLGQRRHRDFTLDASASTNRNVAREDVVQKHHQTAARCRRLPRHAGEPFRGPIKSTIIHSSRSTVNRQRTDAGYTIVRCERYIQFNIAYTAPRAGLCSCFYMYQVSRISERAEPETWCGAWWERAEAGAGTRGGPDA